MANSKSERLQRVTVYAVDPDPNAKEAPIFVAVNGRQFYIQPGAEVEIPESFVKALNNAVIGDESRNPRSMRPQFIVNVLEYDVKPPLVGEVPAEEPTSFKKPRGASAE